MIELAVWSVDGKLVRTVTSGYLEKGKYAFEWNGRNSKSRTVPSGIYFVKMAIDGNSTYTEKILKFK